MKRLLTSTALFLCCIATTFAQFSGSGSGTSSDPYLILNPIQLNQMRNYLNQTGVYFKMMANIDLTDYLEDENPSQGWQPVGSSSSSAFKGILDGNGKSISGLWINRSSTDYVGLFGYTNGATIKNLTVTATTVKGKNYVSIITGYSSSTTISNCTVSGTTIQGNNNVSIISGYGVSTTISGCSASGSIKGASLIGSYIGSSGDNMVLSNNYASVSINASGDYVGGFIGKNVADISLSISNCTLDGTLIRGANYVGGCCGSIEGYHTTSNSINNCIIRSDISGSNYIGGISGYSSGRQTVNLNDCGYVGTITGGVYIGGLIGCIKKIYRGYRDNVQKSFAIGTIIATGNDVGGIVGRDEGYYDSSYANTFYYNISDCYFSGSVTGNANVGGIVGNKTYGNVLKCHAIGSVAGAQNIGGIVGYNKSNTTIKTSVAINTRVTATEGSVGRIVGLNEGTIAAMGSTDENKSYNRTIVISQGVALDINDDLLNGTGVSATTLKLKATYVAMGWDFTDIWSIQETECYPYFKTQTAPPVIQSQVVSGATTVSGKCIDGGTITLEIDGVKQQMVSTDNTFSFTVSPLQAGHEVRVSAKANGKEQSYYTTEIVSYLGSGTEVDPYQVYTAADLTGVYRKGYFKLMNDINLTSYINQFSPTEGWQSIGREGSETIHFDGNGHKITGLWCNSTRDNTGLFSCFANGTIKNLTVEVANGKRVKGGNNTGILIGKMINGTVKNCQVTGNVADGTPVGGLVGLFNGGTISRCKANVTINTTLATSYVGGLVGKITGGTIDQCFTEGTLKATGSESYVGGLVGNNSATISNCYSKAKVISSYNAAGIVAYNYKVVEKCYATGDLSSNNYAAGVIGYNDGSNAVIRKCAAMNNKIDITYESQQTQQGGGYGQRIIGGIKNGAPAPEMNNYALNTMQVSLNDVPQTVYDDIMNGTAKTAAELAQQATYVTLGWDFGETWTMPADGYPELTWLVTATEPEVTLGDLNSDGTINITDVVLIIDVMAGLITDANQVAAADVNGDGDVNITDCVATIDLMAAQQTSSPLMAKTPEMVTVNDYISGELQDGKLTVDLNNENRYTAFQMVVNVPEGMSIVKARMDEERGAEHQVFVRNIGDGQYLVAGFSFDNEELTGNSGQLLTITTEGQSTGDIVIDDVQFATIEAETILLAGITVSGSTTGIADMNVNSEQTVYDLQGRKLDSQILRSHRMQGGNQIVIVNGKKVILK